MEQNAVTNDTIRKARQHLQHLLLRTPGKSPQNAANEAEAIANLAFLEGNPVRDLFITAASKVELERPRSPSPSGTIRPKSSKGFFNKFSRGRDKSAVASASFSQPKTQQPVIEGVTPEFMRCFGPIEDKKPKRKERASDGFPPSSSTATSKGVPIISSGSQKPVRTYEQYKCIVCDQELSSKGVCKRHLEDQHISPRVFECEGCHAYFDTKSDAKKHCGQCSDGEFGFVASKLSKRIYACEFTGDYFLSQGRYISVLLALSEKKSDRPMPNLSYKLAAILRHWTYRNDTKVLQHCIEISQNYFGSSDAWEKLQWEEDALRPKITFLEHATFNEDGMVESARWGGSLAEKRRSTHDFLLELLTSGKLPGQKLEQSSYIKPTPMSVCTTPMPLAYSAPSVVSGPSSIETPLSDPSPTSRSQSRQTVWSHDGISQSSTASTPRSAPNGDEVMTAELKSKRHLSDESRAFIPARTPPGPSELLDPYQYQADPAAPQLPPLPDFMTPSNSTISLPLRNQEGHGLQSTQQQPTVYVPMGQYPPHMYALNLPSSATSSHTLTSDVASETSTLAQSYREPEYLNGAPDDYMAWQQQQQQQHFAYQHSHPPYSYAHYDYSMADDASMVASSVNTGNTVGVEYVTELPKVESYSDMDLTNHHTHPGTFYLPDDGNEHHREVMR